MIRNTVQRTAILETVRSMTDHPTAEQVYSRVSEKCPGISRATVYRVLGNLAEEGEIQRIEVANAPDRFDFTLEPHAHFICDCCGTVTDCQMKHFPEIGNCSGFRPERISVTVHGVCGKCIEEGEKIG